MRILSSFVAVCLTLPQTASAQAPAPEPTRDLARAAARVTGSFGTGAPEAWAPQDPADSLYRRARQALNRNGYAEAAELFQIIRTQHPRSGYVPDAYYWEAYAMYRRGGDSQLRLALTLLRAQQSRHADASTLKSGDARALAARIQGALARSGDEASARVLAEAAMRAAAVPPTPPTPPGPPAAPSPSATPRPPAAPHGVLAGGIGRRDACRDSEDDVQAVALQSLMQMDRDRALPILQKVLARRDAESLCLRRRAVFIISQYEGGQVEDMLLSAARTDPDTEVRSQAVFWLSQVDSPRAVAALDSIAQSATDPEVQERAVFALGQHESPAARTALRRYAERTNISDEIREKALFWIGQSDDPEDIAFLRSLYGRIQQPELRQRILFAIGQSNVADGSAFLLQVARNTSEPLETRKQALFWLSQREETPGTEFVTLYGTFADQEIKEHLIFAMAQRDDRASIDKLIEIARREPQVELRKRAIFWLSQSDDPRVADLLAELLVKP